ncbi:MAG: hypothetical protein KBT10_09010, partial [Bacteroidales bacterium]|nr:hypothetical protein [Candidatus Sodaliphilus aphodohippi]
TISATPIGEATFMGWYDSEGNLLSTDATMVIPFLPAYTGTYTARFMSEETLAAVAESGVENSFYALNDIACAYLTSDYREGYVSLICKDDNGYANKDVKGDDAVDYILSLSGLETRTSQDQSNWIVLNLPEDKVTSTSDLYDLAGKTIVGAQGKFMRDGSNMEIELLQQPTAGDEQTIEYNNYIPANFAGTQTCEGNGLTYFFVTPKPMEVATIHWAYYDGTQFTTIPKMTANGTIFNAAGLEGSVSVNMSMFPDVELIPETSYSFTAIIINNGVASQAPGRRAAAGNAYTVIPVTVPTPDGIEGGIVTGVNDLRNASVQSKNYYNLQGVKVSEPTRGQVVIEQTTWSNGKTTARVIRK